MPSPIFALFNAALLPFLPALFGYTLHRRFIQKKSAQSFSGQWGIISPEMRDFGQRSGPRIWLHAVSVGETMAAKPIIRALKNEIEGVQIALSSTTDTGHQIARALFQNGEVDCIFFFPLDLAPIQNRVLDALRPDALCFVETELWPNLLHLARKKRIATFLVNGRISDNLLKTAPRIGPLWRWMSGNVFQFLMRGEEDAARLQSLGVEAQKIQVIGDVKLEAPSTPNEELRHQWREELGLGEADKVLVCGSTHAGEEAIFLALARQIPDWKIAFAPRHPPRFEEVAATVRAQKMQVVTRSKRKKWRAGEVFLLDSVGELSDFYAVGDAAFVGGSLIPRGGHNLLEPVLRGVPTLFGPSVQNFLAQRDLILTHQLGAQINENDEVEAQILGWLEAPRPDRLKFATHVENALAPHRGASGRMAQHIRTEISARTH